MSDYTDLTAEETVELAELTQQAMRVVRSVSGAHGFNLGMNQGAVAGAGVAAHLHQHVVPRWSGDSNFLPIVAQTKALPVLLEDTRARLVAIELARQQISRFFSSNSRRTFCGSERKTLAAVRTSS